jgi:hypothetical protein
MLWPAVVARVGAEVWLRKRAKLGGRTVLRWLRDMLHSVMNITNRGLVTTARSGLPLLLLVERRQWSTSRWSFFLLVVCRFRGSFTPDARSRCYWPKWFVPCAGNPGLVTEPVCVVMWRRASRTWSCFVFFSQGSWCKSWDLRREFYSLRL